MPALRHGKLYAAGLGAVAFLRVGTGLAAVQQHDIEWAAQPLERRLTQNQYLEQFVAQAMAQFRQADTSGQGLTPADIARLEQQRLAQERAQNMAQVLRYDLNSDLVVTPDEFAALEPETDGRRRSRELDRFDVDGDGRVTVAETVEASARISRTNARMRRDELAELMQLPEARDGRLTAGELEASARAVFARADRDGDGRISAEENRQFRATLPPEKPRVFAPDIYCAMPAADRKDLIVLFGAAEGYRARPAEGGQTGTAIVNIEAGQQPIYLILPSNRAIRWTLTGAVGRVRQAVVVSAEAGNDKTPRGVVGISPQRVRVFGAEGCVRYFGKTTGADADAAKAAVALRLGRQPDVMDSAGAVSNISLPSAVPGAPPAAAMPPVGALGVIEPDKYASKVRINRGMFKATDQGANVYLNRPVASGRRYWEVKLLCGPIMTGVTNNLQSAETWGGWGDKNAGVYTWYPSAWPETEGATRAGRWPSLETVQPRSGTIFGFALDADRRELRLSMNGQEGPLVKLPFAGPYYPHAGIQLAYAIEGGQPCPETESGGEFLSARGALRYPAPHGYRLLGE